MSLTLLALFALPIYLKMVLDSEGTYKLLKEWSTSRGLQFVSAMGSMLLAVLIFSTNPLRFTTSWDSLLSWIGVLIALKGISHLVPAIVARKMSFIKEEKLPIFGFMGLLILLGMVYIDTQIINDLVR